MSKRSRPPESGASRANRPYALGAPHYLRVGWPRPVPVEGKRPLVSGHHGADSSDPHPDEVTAWASTGGFPEANIALVLPDGVIGIDVDDHDGKPGAATIGSAEADWGKLPPTYVSSARPWPNGIRFYRVPTGLAWPRHVAASDDGVEIIRPYLDVAVVAPSWHAKVGARYYWHDQDGSPITGWVPRPEDLPELPATWVEGLTSGQRYSKPDRQAYVGAQAARAWFAERGGGEMSKRVRRALRKRLESMESSAHENARDGLFELARLTAEGEPGTAEAVRRMEEEFMKVAPKRRDGGAAEAQQEWDDAMSGAVGRAEASRAEPARSHPFTDVGNARRLVDSLAGDGKYVQAWGEWVLYDTDSALWVRDRGGLAIMRRMVKVTDAMRRAVEPEAVKFAERSQAAGRLRAAIDLARGHITARAEEFDAEPAALHVTNGCVVLGKDGATFRQRRREDMATLCAPVEYDPDAAHEGWRAFLEKVLPDEEEREWVQMLAGYSLLGVNPERVLVLAIGPNTSGKSTFVEVIASALGSYAATFNLQMLREKRDEGPRVDLLAALPKRFLYTVEASSSVSLFADTIKRATGGDRLTARGMASNVYVEAVPAFTPWLVTNEVPQIPGADPALWKRLKVARFPVSLTPDEVDPELKGRLAAEAREAVLAWLLEGYDLYRAQGLDSPPPAVVAATLAVRESLSAIDLFIAQCCETDPAYEVEAGKLWGAWRAWVEDNGEESDRRMSQTLFGRRLGERGYGSGRSYFEGAQDRARFGLRLKRGWDRVHS